MTLKGDRPQHRGSRSPLRPPTGWRLRRPRPGRSMRAARVIPTALLAGLFLTLPGTVPGIGRLGGPTPASRDPPIPDREPASPPPRPAGHVGATASIGDAAATVPTTDQRPDPSDESTGDL